MSSITPTNFRGSRKHFVSTLLKQLRDNLLRTARGIGSPRSPRARLAQGRRGHQHGAVHFIAGAGQGVVATGPYYVLDSQQSVDIEAMIDTADGPASGKMLLTLVWTAVAK